MFNFDKLINIVVVQTGLGPCLILLILLGSIIITYGKGRGSAFDWSISMAREKKAEIEYQNILQSKRNGRFKIFMVPMFKVLKPFLKSGLKQLPTKLPRQTQ